MTALEKNLARELERKEEELVTLHCLLMEAIRMLIALRRELSDTIRCK